LLSSPDRRLSQSPLLTCDWNNWTFLIACVAVFQRSRDFPPTALATLCQRSCVSLSYTARAFSNNLFCFGVQEEFLEEERDAIIQSTLSLPINVDALTI
ncbi:unnamed protein product, partial [Prunus brigantina]